MEIQKTTHMNLLIEFYGALLTPKQFEYMDLYYANDYSLGEIAEEFAVSRQAVYDNIKRTEAVLEKYEENLQLVADFYTRQKLYDQLETYTNDTYPNDRQLHQFIEQLQQQNK